MPGSLVWPDIWTDAEGEPHACRFMHRTGNPGMVLIELLDGTHRHVYEHTVSLCANQPHQPTALG